MEFCMALRCHGVWVAKQRWFASPLGRKKIVPTVEVSRWIFIPPDISQMNNVGPTMSHPHSYTALSQLTNPYEQQPPGKELNKYASLKAVAEQVDNDFYSKRRHLAELAAKGSLPLHPMRMEHEESNPYNPDLTAVKQNGHKNKISKTHTHPLTFSSNTMKGWDPNDDSSRRHTYSNKKHCTVEQVNELHSSRSQHFLPPQPYFVTNSKTEYEASENQGQRKRIVKDMGMQISAGKQMFGCMAVRRQYSLGCMSAEPKFKHIVFLIRYKDAVSGKTVAGQSLLDRPYPPVLFPCCQSSSVKFNKEVEKSLCLY
ncbi:UNVERIFIED_CONTAM: hypothetical protein FKN15_048354 [Acipenser sinensis]